MNHTLETVKLKLRAFNTHRGRLEDVFKELDAFEKELRAKLSKERILYISNKNHNPDLLIFLKKVLGDDSK